MNKLQIFPLALALILINVGRAEKTKFFVGGTDERFDANGDVIATNSTISSLRIQNLRIPGACRTIRDAHGTAIAQDIFKDRLAISVSGNQADDPIAIFNSDAESVNKLLKRKFSLPTAKRILSRTGTPIVFPETLSDDDVQKLKEAKLPRVSFRKIPMRTYPFNEALTHAVGWATQPVATAEDAIFNTSVGQSAVEFLLDSTLKGKDGMFIVVRDAKDNSPKIADDPMSADNTPLAGDLSVTLDAALQTRLHSQLKNSISQGVVLIAEYSTGALRVMMSYPTFNPNRITPYVLAPVYHELENAPGIPIANRIFRKYKMTEHLTDLEDAKGATPMKVLEQFQRLRSGPAIHVSDSATEENYISTATLATLSCEAFSSKVTRWDGKSEGEMTVTPILNGRYTALILIEGDDAQNDVEKTLNIIESNLDGNPIAAQKNLVKK